MPTNLSKILVVTYFYPPLESVSVIRNAGLIPEFSKLFNETYVLTSSNNFKQFNANVKNLETQKQNFGAKIILKIIYTLDFRTIIYFLKRTTHNAQISDDAKQSLLAKFFLKLKSSFPFSILLSEGSVIYILLTSIKSIQLAKRHNIAYLFSSFYPLADIYVGYLIKLFCPKIIWICDFRDLPVDPYFKNTFFPKFQDRILKFMLKRATKLTTVSNGLKNHLLKYNPRVEVIRNGIDAALFNFKREPFEKFTIAYTGSIYGYDETLRFLSEIILTLKERKIISEQNFQLAYAGKDVATLRGFLKENNVDIFLKSYGQVKRMQALEIQRNAHINLIFSYTLPNFFGILTGKLFEYLAAQNPILVLINGVQDAEFENILSELTAGKVFYSEKDLELATQWLQKLFTEWKTNGVINSKINSEKIKAMQWRDAAEKIFLLGL